MAFAKIYSAQNIMAETRLVSVEVDISRGLHAFSIVGMPDKGVEESRDRVSSAIKNSGFKSPKQTNKKVVVSLAPADMRKEGSFFDVPISLAYLLAEGHVSFNPEGKLFAGELALDGSIRPMRGALSYARLAKKLGIRELYVPKENAEEASLIRGIHVFGVESLRQVIEHLDRKNLISPSTSNLDLTREETNSHDDIRFEDVAGHESAKRGLVIAAAGGHNIALFGPPGTGKTMLAKTLGSIMPDLSFEEMLDVMEIYSSSGHAFGSNSLRPPTRSPHHTSSYSAIIGGSGMRAGEISLAHHGVLFMDEFPEFDSRVIEALRQPLEEKAISISRSKGSIRLPANFMLVIAFNPCPCGNRGARGKHCICTAKDIERYERKLSGPISDRMDMWIEVSEINHDKLMRERRDSKETYEARRVISRARDMQKKRLGELGTGVHLNSQVSSRDMRRTMSLERHSEDTLKAAAESYGLSGRGYHRVIRLARTIADIDGSSLIENKHVLEALQYRQRKIK